MNQNKLRLLEAVGGCWRLLKLPTENSNIENLDVKVSMKNHDYPHLLPHSYHICGNCGTLHIYYINIPHLCGNL